MTEQEKSIISKGLTSEEARRLQEKYGKNELVPKKKENLFLKILEVLKEPMFLLLLIASTIYFILGEPRDGIIMLIFVVAVITIDIVQEWKTDKTLRALKNLAEPKVRVIRDNIERTINSEDLVPGDLMIISEGDKIQADGKVVKLNDLCINESSLTGESEGIWKCLLDSNNKEYWKRDYCYAGTLVIQGSGLIQVEKIGLETEYGKIGVNVVKAIDEPTPLQRQIRELVKICGWTAIVLFILVTIITYFNSGAINIFDRIVESILSGITLSMAMIPEEFPVVLTVFLSMGAWRLAKKNSLVRKLPSVETLGAVSVLCVDKTGTITMNKMKVVDKLVYCNDNKKFNYIMGMACETDTYDPMEHAMLQYCENNGVNREELFSGKLILEYSFTNERKMMGHVWEKDNEVILAAKGSPEKIIPLCNLDKDSKRLINQEIYNMSSKALRVIAIGYMKINNKDEIPLKLEDSKLEFIGLVALHDPPRNEVKNDINRCKRAGIKVVMITGDNGITAKAIANEVGILSEGEVITGDMINKMSDEELRKKVMKSSIFSRVIPEHKMRIVKAFKENGEIVAMTGDGVNDAPALKYADIGVAMGKRGSEISREAADLILLDDNFTTIVDTIKDGRRIYDNIKKAIGYIFTIHIPIALSALLAPFLGIESANLLLLPVHVVLLELIIDPTCSIVLERQPAENNILECKPRKSKDSILKINNVIKSILQGIILFLASFGTYYFYLLSNPNKANVARTLGLSIIMISNLFLVFINCSDKNYMYKNIKSLLKDKVMWCVVIGTIIGLGIIVYSPLNSILKLAPLTIYEVIFVIVVSAISIGWYDLVKLISRLV